MNKKLVRMYKTSLYEMFEKQPDAMTVEPKTKSPIQNIQNVNLSSVNPYDFRGGEGSGDGFNDSYIDQYDFLGENFEWVYLNGQWQIHDTVNNTYYTFAQLFMERIPWPDGLQLIPQGIGSGPDWHSWDHYGNIPFHRWNELFHVMLNARREFEQGLDPNDPALERWFLPNGEVNWEVVIQNLGFNPAWLDNWSSIDSLYDTDSLRNYLRDRYGFTFVLVTNPDGTVSQEVNWDYDRISTGLLNFMQDLQNWGHSAFGESIDRIITDENGNIIRIYRVNWPDWFVQQYGFYVTDMVWEDGKFVLSDDSNINWNNSVRIQEMLRMLMLFIGRHIMGQNPETFNITDLMTPSVAKEIIKRFLQKYGVRSRGRPYSGAITPVSQRLRDVLRWLRNRQWGTRP